MQRVCLSRCCSAEEIVRYSLSGHWLLGRDKTEKRQTNRTDGRIGRERLKACSTLQEPNRTGDREMQFVVHALQDYDAMRVCGSAPAAGVPAID